MHKPIFYILNLTLIFWHGIIKKLGQKKLKDEITLIFSHSANVQYIYTVQRSLHLSAAFHWRAHQALFHTAGRIQQSFRNFWNFPAKSASSSGHRTSNISVTSTHFTYSTCKCSVQLHRDDVRPVRFSLNTEKFHRRGHPLICLKATLTIILSESKHILHPLCTVLI